MYVLRKERGGEVDVWNERWSGGIAAAAAFDCSGGGGGGGGGSGSIFDGRPVLIEPVREGCTLTTWLSALLDSEDSHRFGEVSPATRRTAILPTDHCPPRPTVPPVA